MSHRLAPLVMLSLLVCHAASMAADAAGTATPRPAPKRTRFLLLDARIIETTENARLVLGKPAKSPHNPLMREDKPWEQRFDNLYANVIYDEEAQLYKCWYSPFIVDYSAEGMTLDQRRNKPYRPPRGREMAVCYATSRDGIHWQKPELGLVEFQGSKQNNIVWRGPHGTGIFRDAHDVDPARRYKALFKSGGMCVAFSADGIHWGRAIACPQIAVAGDTHNNALWAPTLGRYVGITRTWGREKGRQVARTESRDFLQWTKAAVVLEGLDRNFQTYAMPVFFHGGVYLGLVAIHDQRADRVWTELTWSPDTVEWHRICPGTPLIANAREELACDWGCVYAAAYPIFQQDRILIYYGGSDGRHTSWRQGYLCLATLRPDGFAGYAPAQPGRATRITTAALVCMGEVLRVSADVLPGGSLKVLLLDRQKQRLAESEPIGTTVSDAPIRWKDGLSLRELQGQEIRLQFKWHDAVVYSFSFAEH